MKGRDVVLYLFLGTVTALAFGFFVWYTLTPMALAPTDMPYPTR